MVIVMPRTLRASIALACLTATSVVRAQQASPASVYVSAPPSPVMAAIVPSDVGPPPPDAVSLPMRLSLLSTITPRAPRSSGGGGCGAESVAAAGTIFPTQQETTVRLTPRLTLFGFSDQGCPGDPYAALEAGAGGGFAYTAPVQKGLWLVASGGMYVQPGYAGIASTTAAGGGLDFMWKTRGGQTRSAGIGFVNMGRSSRVMARYGGTF
jgi:hypothetical protein